MENRVSVITLGVADVSRAGRSTRRWAGRVSRRTAMSSSSRPAAWCSPSGDGTSWPRTARSTDPGGWGGVTLAYNVGSPAEVDVVLAAAAQPGPPSAGPGAQTFWGGYSGIFIDPDGHPWEVAHNPGWVLAEDGSVHLHRMRRRRHPSRRVISRPPRRE